MNRKNPARRDMPDHLVPIGIAVILAGEGQSADRQKNHVGRMVDERARCEAGAALYEHGLATAADQNRKGAAFLILPDGLRDAGCRNLARKRCASPKRNMPGPRSEERRVGK